MQRKNASSGLKMPRAIAPTAPAARDSFQRVKITSLLFQLELSLCNIHVAVGPDRRMAFGTKSRCPEAAADECPLLVVGHLCISARC